MVTPMSSNRKKTFMEIRLSTSKTYKFITNTDYKGYILLQASLEHMNFTLRVVNANRPFTQ